MKGAGVDCGLLLVAVFAACGLVPLVDPGEYPADWALHRSEERYLAIVERFARKIEGPPLPGDIALFRWGRCISHGAIVLEWPLVIHAYVRRGVTIDSVEQDAALSRRLAGFWSVWA